jgi:glycosyltransferase involved in cell wall biosynthesis
MKTIEERREYFQNFQHQGAHEDNKSLPSKRGGWYDEKSVVILTVYNEEKFIEKTLKSVELAMKNLDWVMVIGNDASTDRTLEIINDFKTKSSATKFDVYDFDKAENVACAKNRTISRALLYMRQYKWVFLMDGDDIMGACRAKGLLANWEQQPSYIYVADWTHCSNGEEKLMKAWDSNMKCNFGPWATMINSEIIPEDGQLFYEGKDVHEDLILWKELFSANVSVGAAEGINACYYNSREGTLSKHENLNQRKEIWRDHKRFCLENNLLSPEEAEKREAMKDVMENPLLALNLPEGSIFSIEEVDPESNSDLEPVPKNIDPVTEEEAQKAKKELDIANLTIDIDGSIVDVDGSVPRNS